jgi:FAD/FMN-containing dehydrogenase
MAYSSVGTVQQTFAPDALASLRGSIAGDVITGGDDGYDAARAVWNGMIDRHPALVVRCSNTSDVVEAVRFAREHDLPIAVRGGGHSVAGHSTCDDGIVIDLKALRTIELDSEKRIAHAGGGVTWGELDAATQEFGLAAPGGVFSRTGIAGLTLGGGYGWLRSTYGLACDSLISAEVVTADGSIVIAGDQTDEDPELLWGLRGGGGNFGIVTRFTFNLHPVGPETYCAVVFHDGEGDAMERNLRWFREFCETAPDEVNPIGVCGIVPADEELYPREIHGRRFVFMGALYVGPVEEGERVLAPLRTFAEPLVDFSGAMPFVDVQKLWDADYPDGGRYYWKSLNFREFDDEAIAIVAANARRLPSDHCTIDLWPVGGVMKRTDSNSSAFVGRDAALLLSVSGNWNDAADDDAHVRWTKEAVAELEPLSDGSRYLNFGGFQEEGEELMRSSFGPHYDRLAALKRRFDPENRFRLNQNISPSHR